MADPLSDVLNHVGVKSSVYFQKEFYSPWCMSISDTGFAQFHIIVRGNAVVMTEDKTMQVSAGDIVLFPKGAAHKIADAPDSPPMNGQDVILAMENGDEPFSEGEVTTRMICGHFDYDFTYSHSLFEELPEMILLGADELPESDYLFGLLRLIIKESASEAPGSQAILRHLSDGLLVTILRGYFEVEKHDVGFYRGLKDERISRALAAVHSDSGCQLSVDELAGIAGMSRSSFLDHFKALMGQSAGAYATRWKLLQARAALAATTTSIEGIASSAGYSSATAFSRAFQSHFQETPTQYRNKVS